MGKFTYNMRHAKYNINICEIGFRLIYLHMQINYVYKYFMYLYTQDIDVQIT